MDIILFRGLFICVINVSCSWLITASYFPDPDTCLQWILVCAFAGQDDTWHYLLGLFAVLTLLSMVAFPFLPESPKYLYIVRGHEEKGIKGM